MKVETKQMLPKAIVSTITVDGESYRLYAPYRGNLTQRKREIIDEVLLAKYYKLCIGAINRAEWTARDVELTWRIDGSVMYKEDYASGCLKKNLFVVCTGLCE